MSQQITQSHFTSALFDLLDETFENHHGIYTYKGTSLLETLKTITAAEASIPIGGLCPTLAAQVAHVTFYLEALERYINKEDLGDVDWEHIWNTVHAVTPEAWSALQADLTQTYRNVVALLRSFDTWDSEERIGGSLAIVTHTAYHLGVIRQSLCVVKTGDAV